MGIQFMFFCLFYNYCWIVLFQHFSFSQTLGKTKEKTTNKNNRESGPRTGTHKLVKRHLNRKGTPTPRLHHNPITTVYVCVCARVCHSEILLQWLVYLQRTYFCTRRVCERVCRHSDTWDGQCLHGCVQPCVVAGVPPPHSNPPPPPQPLGKPVWENEEFKVLRSLCDGPLSPLCV